MSVENFIRCGLWDLLIVVDATNIGNHACKRIVIVNFNICSFPIRPTFSCICRPQSHTLTATLAGYKDRVTTYYKTTTPTFMYNVSSIPITHALPSREACSPATD